MDRYEREKIEELPYEFRPLGAWTYFLLTILYNIPVIGFIMMIIHATDHSNINRRNFARSYLCGLLVAVILYILFSSLVSKFIYEFLQNIDGLPYYY